MRRRQDPVDRASLVGNACLLLTELRDRFAGRIAELEGLKLFPGGDFLDDHFDAWVDQLTRAPAKLLEPRAMRAIIDEAIGQALMRSTGLLRLELGEEGTTRALRAFPAALDRDRFAAARDATEPEWLDAVLRLPEPPPGEPTLSDVKLRERIGAMTAEERAATTKLDLGELRALRDVSPLRELPALQELTISAAMLRDLSPLRALSGLRKVDLTARVTDLAWLSPAAESLEELDLQGCPLVNDLEPLAAFPRLRVLELSTDTVRDLSALARIPSLRELRLWGRRPVDLTPVTGLTQLTTLDLFMVPVRTLEPFGRLTALRKLRVSFSADLGDLSAIAQLKDLEEVDFGGATTLDLSPIRDLPSLRVLHASSSDVVGLPHFQTLPRLEDLDVELGVLHTLRGIEAARALRRLSFCCTTLSDLSPLSGLESLERLCIMSGGRDRCRVTDLRPLRGLKRLTHLDIDGATLRDLTPLAELRALEVVMLPRTDIESVEPLASLPELRSVTVNQCDHLTSLRPLASCPKLATLECDECDRLRGPKTIEQLRAPAPPAAAKTYPSAGVVPPRAGVVTTIDLRGNLPRTPPEGWSMPEMADDEGELCSIDADGVRLHVALLTFGDHPGLIVGMATLREERVGDKVAARVLRRLRACDPFVEIPPDHERYADVVPEGASYIRVFAARAYPSSPDSWAAARHKTNKLTVEPTEGDGPVEGAATTSDVARHMPDPVPEGWRVVVSDKHPDTVRNVFTPEAHIVVTLQREEGSDVVVLAVGLIPPENAPTITDDRARQVLRLFRRRGTFEERSQGPFAGAPGMRVFAAKTHG